MKRMFPMIAPSSSLLRRRQCQRFVSTAASANLFTRGGGQTNCKSSLPSSHCLASSSRKLSLRQTQRLRYNNNNSAKWFSSLAQDWDGDDDDYVGGTTDDFGGGGGPLSPKLTPLLPTTHSRNTPPAVCPPSQLSSEVESIFDADIGTLIIYPKGSDELKSAEEEMADAYYASDAIVQRVEYIMRGLNARISKHSFVSRSLRRGFMMYEEEVDVGGRRSTVDDDDDGEGMTREACFSAMLDLLGRMAKEGRAYNELRTRVRSQLVDPSLADATAAEDSSSSSSSSDDDSSSSDEEEGRGGGGVDEQSDRSFTEWTESMDQSMRKAKISNPGINSTADEDSEGEGGDEEISEELYQFGADPGVTTHMYDLVLDSTACLCQEQYGLNKNPSSSIDMAELMPKDPPISPPELAKDLLDTVLNRHWMDGGDIGLGGGGSDGPINGIAQGIGIGAGTGAGSLAYASPFNANFDIRTCPTPMTFNAVIRVAANFDPMPHAEAVENAKILSGAMGNASLRAPGNTAADQMKQEQERLRDVTIDAALSTYSRMQDCSALTLRALRNSTKKATSRGALKRQARLLNDNYNKDKGGIIGGRNSATYSYLIQTLSNCILPSTSRGNITYALYHKGCVQEGVMDERLVKAMRGVGGYAGDGGDDVRADALPPPISNGPIFDSFMQKELGGGVASALDKGRKLRQDRNHKLRRMVEWDDTY